MVAPTKIARNVLNRARNIAGKFLYNVDGPVIVYNMAKVGSRSVYETLYELGIGVPTYHCHILHDLDEMERALVEEARKNNQPHPAVTLQVIEEGKRLRRQVDKDGKWNIITLVRDPIAQSVSQFFHHIGEGEFLQKGRERILSGKIRADELIEIFLTKWRPGALDWFERQFEPVFGIDVYSEPLPREKGYFIFGKGRFSALLIRLEDLDRCAEEALGELLGIHGIELQKRNTADDKWYSGIYREFRSGIVVPDEYLDWMYESRYSRHFYTPGELERFRCRWKKTK